MMRSIEKLKLFLLLGFENWENKRRRKSIVVYRVVFVRC